MRTGSATIRYPRAPVRHRIRRLVWMVAFVLIVSPPGPATAEPVVEPVLTQILAAARPAENGSHLTAVRAGPGRRLDLQVYSAAMNTTVTVRVLRAADPARPAPVLYLLNGAHGGRDDSSWNDRTDIDEFFVDEQVTVVVPMGGAGSYFTDWRSDDPILGRQRWTTFLTKELPPVIDSAFSGTGANAIAGI
ncbi:alpha/beta hydrolase, partial [Nocardia cyriacigeorgica]|uniref:alpha/beta hydrolase n=1 Tax=Nocardia cyriacigeorgica TaxID=135487 RepID=UPI0024581246